MKFKQLLIPIMAMVFAIGMSFTTEKSAATVWANMGGTAVAVETEEDCGVQETHCYGEFEDGGPAVPLYLDQALSIPILGAGEEVKIKRVINP